MLFPYIFVRAACSSAKYVHNFLSNNALEKRAAGLIYHIIRGENLLINVEDIKKVLICTFFYNFYFKNLLIQNFKPF